MFWGSDTVYKKHHKLSFVVTFQSKSTVWGPQHGPNQTTSKVLVCRTQKMQPLLRFFSLDYTPCWCFVGGSIKGSQDNNRLRLD